jgi:hypothetical protein
VSVDHGSGQVELNLRDSLPEIQQELEKSMINARLVLSKLPKESSKDPRNEISNLLHGFVTHLSKHMEGVPDEDGLIQSIRPVQEKFRSAIRQTAPEFCPFERRYAGSKTFPRETFLTNEEGDASDVNADVSSDVDSSFRRKRIYIDEVLKRAHQ